MLVTNVQYYITIKSDIKFYVFLTYCSIVVYFCIGQPEPMNSTVTTVALVILFITTAAISVMIIFIWKRIKNKRSRQYPVVTE